MARKTCYNEAMSQEIKNLPEFGGKFKLSHQEKYSWTVSKIVSGGQTGADRAALDWAIKHGIPHGGWCPKGRRSEEKGPIDKRYLLRETPTRKYKQRTEWNVRDSDGTVIFSIKPKLTGGSLLTLRFAMKHDKPHLHLYRQGSNADPVTLLLEFLYKHNIHVLNIAGPRAGEEPEIGQFVTEVLEKAFAGTLPGAGG